MKNFTSLYLLVVLSLVACGPKLPPNVTLSPVGKTAVYARQFVIGGNAAVTGLDTLMASGVLPAAYGLPAVDALKKVAVATGKLADSLTALDAAVTAADKATKLAEAHSILVSMTTYLDGATSPITDPKIKALVQADLSTFQALVKDFAAQLTTLLATPKPGNLAPVIAELRAA